MKLGMQYDAPYEDPAWRDELERVCPSGTGLGWLKLVWEPGDRWEPVGRWIIYQMSPPGGVPDLMFDFLKGPNPRTMGYFKPDGTWESTAPPISMRQWLLFRETKCFGTPYWIVQGYHGGHRYRLFEPEKQMLELMGQVPDVPVPGDLPYAEPNALVWAKLGELDNLRRWSEKHLTSFEDRPLDDAERLKQEFRDRLGTFLDTQAREIAEDLGTFRHVIDDAPVAPDNLYGVERALESREATFMEGI